MKAQQSDYKRVCPIKKPLAERLEVPEENNT